MWLGILVLSRTNLAKLRVSDLARNNGGVNRTVLLGSARWLVAPWRIGFIWQFPNDS
jgi:hypothetical protein